MSARSMRAVSWLALLAALAAGQAQASDAAPASPPSPPASRTWSAFVEGSVFVPDPIQAPPGRQLDVVVAVADGGGVFLRLRAGGATRPLGSDVLGVIEAGVGGTSAWGLVGDLALGVGGRQQFTAGDLYVAQADGSVARATDLGTTLLLATVSAGVGYDFRGVTDVPLRLMVVPRLQFTAPQRDQAAVELGIGLRAGWTF